jgi:hypothetical protein
VRIFRFQIHTLVICIQTQGGAVDVNPGDGAGDGVGEADGNGRVDVNPGDGGKDGLGDGGGFGGNLFAVVGPGTEGNKNPATPKKTLLPTPPVEVNIPRGKSQGDRLVLSFAIVANFYFERFVQNSELEEKFLIQH